MESLSVKPVSIQSIGTTIGIGGIGAMFPFEPIYLAALTIAIWIEPAQPIEPLFLTRHN